ncbi:MAG: DNA helicase II, partial [Proteobacteria bacterium]|nr:DNA helicase II [Pseudomonadota bacterium]
MRYIADLHVHSPFSRATSKKSDLPGLAAWAAIKGIQVVGTGDFTHPGWLAQLKKSLEPAEPGFFRLKEQKVPSVLPDIVPDLDPIRFVLTAEISCIYKKADKVRKIHNILLVPDFGAVAKINAELAA